MKKTLFTIALPEEKICLPESDDIKVVVTKVGKACSAYFLIKALYEYKPDIVINIGTAGTFNMNVGDIVVSNRFYDRDLAPLTIEGVVSEINSCSNVSLPSLLRKPTEVPHTATNGTKTASCPLWFAAQALHGSIMTMKANHCTWSMQTGTTSAAESIATF